MTFLSPAASRRMAACTVLSLFLAPAMAQQADKQAALVTGPAVNPAYMDPSANPGDDFYAYCCGTWEKNTTIPPDRSEVSPATPLFDLQDRKLADLIEEAGKKGTTSTESGRRVFVLYHSFMNEAAIEAQGTKPLAAPLKKIADIRDRKQLARALGETLRADEDALNNTNFHSPNLFGLWVAPGFEDTSRYTAYLMQGGLALPDREYYLSQSDAMKKIRQQYRAHIVTLMTLAGFDNV